MNFVILHFFYASPEEVETVVKQALNNLLPYKVDCSLTDQSIKIGHYTKRPGSIDPKDIDKVEEAVEDILDDLDKKAFLAERAAQPVIAEM